jgi:predicted O-methyltransferase YrrM/SAM-dependent methyltransferase
VARSPSPRPRSRSPTGGVPRVEYRHLPDLPRGSCPEARRTGPATTPRGGVIRAIVKDFVAAVAATLPAGGPVIEFGACQAQPDFGDLRPFFPGCAYLGCDITHGPGVDLVTDVHGAALAAGSTGCVLMVDALEHVESPLRAVNEIHRLLRPGGALVVTSVMNYPIHDPTDYWRFTPQALSLLLRGFAWSSVEAIGQPDFPHTVAGVAFKDTAPTELDDLVRVMDGWRRSWSRVTSEAELQWGSPASVTDRLRRLVPPALGEWAARARRLGRGLWHARRRLRSSLRLPRRQLGALFPGIERTVVDVEVAAAFPARGSLPPPESLVLAAICRHLRPRRVLEIGTFTGGSTLAMAMNLPSTSDIVTIDLPSHEGRSTRYPLELGDIGGQPFTVGQRFRGTVFESRIRQLYADSATLDFSALPGPFDVIFIDGNHNYENVKSDSLKGHAVLRRGGVMIWDDYDPAFGPGVMAFLHHWAGVSSTYQIEGTRLALYRSP